MSGITALLFKRQPLGADEKVAMAHRSGQLEFGAPKRYWIAPRQYLVLFLLELFIHHGVEVGKIIAELDFITIYAD